MNARQRSHLNNVNRVLIFALSVGGLLTDGPQLADLPAAAALFVWLWLPPCTRVETYLLHRVDGRQRSGRSPGASPSH